MRRVWLHLFGLFVLVAALAVAGGWWILRSAGGGRVLRPEPAPQQESASRPRENAARPDVFAVPGVIEPFEAVPVSAKVSASIAALYVRDGSPVRKGQLLCTLEDTDLRREINAVRLQLAQGREALRQAEEKRAKQGQTSALRLEAARVAQEAAQRDLETFRGEAELQLKQVQVQRERAERELREYEELYDAKAVPLEDLRQKRQAAEDARLAHDQRRQSLDNQREAKEQAVRRAAIEYDQAKLESEREEVSAQQIAALRLQVQNAENDLAEKQGRLADLRVVAPIDGTVRIIPRARTSAMVPTGESAEKLGPGVRVWEGDPFLEIATTERACVRIEVDETDVGRLYVGMTAKITGDAFARRELSGRIVAIQTSGKKAGEGVSLFPVTVLITSPLNGIRIGMTADVTINLAQPAPATGGER